MPIDCVCPSCEHVYEADDGDIGQPYVCPQCQCECFVPSARINQGDVYGDYEVAHPLGAGATSEVHLAHHRGTGQQVALKVLFVDEADAWTDTERFMREAKNAMQLDHPGIVKIYEVGRDRANGHHFLAMEYVQGETLEALLEHHGEIGELDALLVIRNVADALAYAWDKLQLIHRDVKPANIILSYEGETKLMDLGIAQSVLDICRLTDPDTVIGSPPYMSPEQCSPRNSVDFRADIYSLGATLFHLLTREYAFYGPNPVETVRMQLYTPLPDPREYTPDLHAATVELVRHMMAKSSRRRPGSWAELIDEIDGTVAVVRGG